MARIAAVLAVLIGLIAGATAAHAQEGPLVGAIPAAVQTDGASLAAWQQSDGRVVLLADAVPAGRTQEIELPRSCPLQVVSGRMVGLLCAGAQPMLYDVLTRRERHPEGVPAAHAITGTGAGAVLSGLGDRWLRLTGPDATALLDWSRGRVIGNLRLGPREVVDLDARSAKRRLCAPLRAPIRGDVLLPAVSLPPYLLARTANGALALRRCGSEAAVTLTRDAEAPFVLTARFAAWAVGSTVRIRDLSSAETASWRTPRGTRVTALRATDRRLFAETAPAGAETTTYVLEPLDG